MLRSLLSAICSSFLSVRYYRHLGIRNHEIVRYFKKSANLGLCYGAFVRPFSMRGCWSAGVAAFLTCAYDVVTDWRAFTEELRGPFEGILRHILPDWATELTWSLYWLEVHGKLADDGLERGVITVEVIVGLVGSREAFLGFGMRRLGLLLQIVDDVLDLEDDTEKEELNCLTTTRRDRHLRYLRDNMNQLLELFRRDRIMHTVVADAGKKASSLMVLET